MSVFCCSVTMFKYGCSIRTATLFGFRTPPDADPDRYRRHVPAARHSLRDTQVCTAARVHLRAVKAGLQRAHHHAGKQV